MERSPLRNIQDGLGAAKPRSLRRSRRWGALGSGAPPASSNTDMIMDIRGAGQPPIGADYTGTTGCSMCFIQDLISTTIESMVLNIVTHVRLHST